MKVWLLTINTSIVLILSSCLGKNISEIEKQSLLNESAFNEYGFKFPNAPLGKYTKLNLPGGATEIEYIYRGYAEDSSYLYISNTITIDDNAGEAEATYRAKSKSIQIGKILNTKPEMMEGFEYGNKSILYILISDNEPIGNYFQFQLNNITYQLILQGFYFSDMQSWERFFKAKIEPAVSKIF